MIDEKILIERLEEEMKGHLNLYCDGLIKAMSIAKDLAESYHIHCEQEYMKGYEDGAESVRAMMPYEEHNNGWIPCSERMPEYEKEMYLVQTAYGLMDVLRFTKDAYKLDKYDFYEYKNKKKSMFYDHDSEYGYAEVDVIAWQPLPAPYKKGE